jgi:hypothetical protein
MSQPRTRWHVSDSAEPLLVWRARLPCPSGVDDGAVTRLVAELLEVLTTSGLVRARAPLPTEAAVLEGLADRSPSMVTIRNERGEVVDVEADDAGALLRRIEGSGLDVAYARRFAALGHPFVAVWCTHQQGELELSVAFFSTLFFDRADADVWTGNQRRLATARDGIIAVCRRRGGRLIAPLTLDEARADMSLSDAQRRSQA